VPGETDLRRLLGELDPEVVPGSFVVVTAVEPLPVVAVATVREAEGVAHVLSRPDADRLGLTYDVVLGWITLRVHSALDAVGLTASVATALTEAGISANALAGFHHDHLLVPVDRTEEAVAVLRSLSVRHR
jgi:uncharacterized protein